MRREPDSSHQPSPAHVLSIDVEEHFQVSAFERHVPVDAWSSHSSRVVANTDRILELMAVSGATGTFFVVGWVAEREPALVRRIAAGGHELASHSYWHRRVSTLSADQFREDVRRARRTIEDAAGVRVRGFRAPSFSILRGCEWAYDILLEEGHTYDSSVFPVRRPGYGNPGAPPSPHYIRRTAGALFEIPMTTRRCLGMRLPAAGGAYLRLLPFEFVRGAFAEAEECGMFYAHPWEIDPAQPRIPAGWLTRVRHYGGLGGMYTRIGAMLAQFRFVSVREAYGARAGWDEAGSA
jgi:polysaccharide deacetylase family protein (PEP-CTERM system associated)